MSVVDADQQELENDNQPKQELALGTLALVGIAIEGSNGGFLRISKAGGGSGSARGGGLMGAAIAVVAAAIGREELEIF